MVPTLVYQMYVTKNRVRVKVKTDPKLCTYEAQNEKRDLLKVDSLATLSIYCYE